MDILCEPIVCGSLCNVYCDNATIWFVYCLIVFATFRLHSDSIFTKMCDCLSFEKTQGSHIPENASKNSNFNELECVKSRRVAGVKLLVDWRNTSGARFD